MIKMLSKSIGWRNNVLRYFSQQKKDNTFGFQSVATSSKQSLVNEVFNSVANKYDLMNDAMSGGIHRYWKNQFVKEVGNLNPANLYSYQKKEPLRTVLDVAGGTGDISFRILENHHFHNIKTTVLDINQSMLDEGQKKAQHMKISTNNIQFICANAEQLPFPDNTFDVYTISFGLRNVPRTKKALEEARRVLKYGGRFMCLQFSKVQNPIFKQIYNWYSFNIIPELGQVILGDRSSYQYLVESIEKFYSQEDLLKMMEEVGFSNAKFVNYTDGIVALHSGFKLN